MKKQLLFLICILNIFICQSQTFNDGVLQYQVTDPVNNYVSVSKYNNTCATGSVTIPETINNNHIIYTVTSIVNSTFKNCVNLTNIDIPESVISLGGSAFYNCPNLLSVVIPSGVTTIGYQVFAGCESLTSIIIPDGVTIIGVSTFFRCEGLTSVVIPEGVLSIGESAFGACIDLTNVVIPESVTSIGSHAFRECTSLASVTVNWNTPLAISSTVFADIGLENTTLNVPIGTVALYQSAAVWQDFGLFSLSISQVNETIALKLYPNPAQDVLYINLEKGIKLNKVNIYNSLGQFVTSTKNLKINTTNLTSGIYFIEVKTDKGSSVKRIVIE